jgi:hypothetical protein
VDGEGGRKGARTARGGGKQHGRAAGFLDGSESPDLRKYETILREAAEEVLGPLSPPSPRGGRRLPESETNPPHPPRNRDIIVPDA